MNTLKTVKITIITLTLLLSVQSFSKQKESVEAGKDAVIERVYIQRSSSYDPGTIVAALNNKSKSPVEIGRIRVNGSVVKEWPEPSNPIMWHRVSHKQLKPGNTGLIQLKIAQHASGMIRLNVEINGKEHTTLLSSANYEPIRIHAVRYDPNGTKVNIFLTNSADKVQKLNTIELNDKKVWPDKDRCLYIKPNSTHIIHIALKEPLNAGQIVRLRLLMDNRVIVTRDRAIPGFRMSIESGDKEMAKRINADPVVLDSFQFREQPAPQKQPDAALSLVERQGSKWSLVHVTHGRHVSKEESDLACVFACPTHATDSYHTSAYLAMRAQAEVEKKSCWQSFIHACRSQPLRGIAMFGQIADAVRFNAQINTAFTGKSENIEKIPYTVYRLTGYAVNCSAPSIALPMIPLERDRALFPRRAPLAIEARQMVYAAISAGAGGIAYRIMEQNWGDETRDPMIDEIKMVNNEIRSVRDYLAMGFPRPIAESKDPKIQATIIDATPKAMLLILINHDLRKSPPEVPPSVNAILHENVIVKIDIPDVIKDVSIREINDIKLTEFDTFNINNSSLVLNVPKVKATCLLIIEPEK